MSGDSGVTDSVADDDRSREESSVSAGQDVRSDAVSRAVDGNDICSDYAGDETRAAAGRADVVSRAVAECDGRTDHSGGNGSVTPTYDATRRTPRKHRRVVFRGTELFDADGVKLEPGDMTTDAQRDADDDQRILTELPPHWGVFNDKR